VSTSERSRQRLQWARDVLRAPHLELVAASSDASFRSYWRTRGFAPTRIVMDAPPDREDLGPWLDIAARLRHAELNAPRVLAENREAGFLLLSDLGNDLLLPALHDASVDRLYGDALRALLQMQTEVDASGLPDYDESRLVSEMELLPTWFLQRHLGIDIACEQWDVIELAFRALVQNAQAQPQVFVHRDYHSRNLMLASDGLGIIDFQDAVRGPITYDLVSLLRDCYIAWPLTQVECWVEDYRQQALRAGLTSADPARFLRWFDLMGLQRHIKVLGIFCRLNYRDGKPAYLGDLPLVWSYVRDVGLRYPEIAPLIELLDGAIAGRDLTRPA
jgi:aminoglycoside/choline kinase family phosphotransferase